MEIIQKKIIIEAKMIMPFPKQMIQKIKMNKTK